MINPPLTPSKEIPFSDSKGHLLASLAMVDIRVRWAVQRARANGLNPHDEFRGLYITDEKIDQLLEYDIGQHLWSSNGHNQIDLTVDWQELLGRAISAWKLETETSRKAGIPLRLDRLQRMFSLDDIELQAFLLVTAPELDPRYLQIYAYLQDDVTQKRPSIDLLLNLLTEDFTEKLMLRRLFEGNGRLTRSGLLKEDGESGNKTLLQKSMRPAPHVVSYLLENNQLDLKLSSFAKLITVGNISEPRRISSDLLAKIIRNNDPDRPPIFSFIGPYGTGKFEAARHLSAAAEGPLLLVDLAKLVDGELGIDQGLADILRDGRLLGAILYLKRWESILKDGRPPAKYFADILDYPRTVVVESKTTWQPVGGPHRRPIYAVSFPAPKFDDRYRVWMQHLGHVANLDLAAVANHFRFTHGQIEDVVATAHDLARWDDRPLENTDLLLACRLHSNQNLANLATKIHPRYTWDDIILPSDTLNQLYEMVNTVKQRPVVYGEWGFDRKLALGKGLSALFAGESGTGKTMSADIMSGSLGLDLYKIDLSMVISKYIGETEKNLDRIFTEAATSNAILFFDEADAIFGKRSEVKDSHDRYANIEISYLLQRMEMYDGVVILATNMRANLDEAFTRRLHFAIEFPFPEAHDRERIWKVNFPEETPKAEDIDYHVLGQRFRVSGGNIRNIILAAAFLAAKEDRPVGMKHLLHAAKREYQKIGRLIDEDLFELPVVI